MSQSDIYPCVDVLANGDIRTPVVRYLCWFNMKTKYEQDEDKTRDKLAETSNSVLEVTIPNVGLNPYKMMEMYKNNRPDVPDEFRGLTDFVRGRSCLVLPGSARLKTRQDFHIARQEVLQDFLSRLA